jgi:hypothetical protein
MDTMNVSRGDALYYLYDAEDYNRVGSFFYDYGVLCTDEATGWKIELIDALKSRGLMAR